MKTTNHGVTLEHEIDSVAFPAISTGVFGYPVREAAEVAFKTIIAALPKLRYLKKIRLCLHSDEVLSIHSETLSRLVSKAFCHLAGEIMIIARGKYTGRE